MSGRSNQGYESDQDSTPPLDVKSRIAAFQNSSSSQPQPQYATYQSKLNSSPVLIRPSPNRSTHSSTNSQQPTTKTTSPIPRHNSLPRERDFNLSPSSSSRLSNSSSEHVSEFGIIKSGEGSSNPMAPPPSKASTFGGRSNAGFASRWNNGTGGTYSTASSFHLGAQEDRQSNLRKSGSGMSLRELAAQSDSARSRSNSVESGQLGSSRRGSPAGTGSGASSPRLGVKNIIALYGGNGQLGGGGVAAGSLGRSSSPSSFNGNHQSPYRLGVSIPDASASADSLPIRKRPPRHMLDASEDGSTALELHPTLSPSPSIHSPIRSGASSPAGDLLTSNHQTSPISPQSSFKPPAPPRPPKPNASTSTSTNSTNTPPKLPQRFTVQPPTPARQPTTESPRSSSHSPNRFNNSNFSAPLLPPRKGAGTISAGVSPSSTGDGSSVNYQTYVSRKEQVQIGPALPPRMSHNGNNNHSDTPPRRSSADAPNSTSKPPPLPRRSMGNSSSAASDLSVSSNGSAASTGLIPPPRHKLPPQSHHVKNASSGTFSSVSLSDDASAELKHSLESQIGERETLVGGSTGFKALSSENSNSRRTAPLTPTSNPLLPPPRAVRSLAQGAPSRVGGPGAASGFRFGSGSSPHGRSAISLTARGRPLVKKNVKTKRNFTPDQSSRNRYETLFERMLVAESIKKSKMRDKKTNSSNSGIAVPRRRDLNRTITSNESEEEISAGGVQALKGWFDQSKNSQPSTSGHEPVLATSAPSERENPLSSNSFNLSSIPHHRSTASAGPGLETSFQHSTNPYIPTKRILKLWKSSRINNNEFFGEIWNEVVKHQESSQLKGLEREAFVRGLSAIDGELRRRKAKKSRRKGNMKTSRKNTIRASGRLIPPKPPTSNWEEVSRLPSNVKRVVPPHRPVNI